MRFQTILPTFNASRWFEAALASIAGHPLGEVLVIDDGSDDPEREAVELICKRYAGVRFFAEPHRGLVGTLNFGLSLATAPYVARMDADDIALPGRFDKQLAFLETHADVALVGGQMVGIDSEGQLTGKFTRFPSTPKAISDYLARGRNPFMHPSVMMRRDSILAAGGYRAATELAEDYDLWLRLAELYPLANLDEALIQYRRHDNQITRSTNWKQKFARDLATLSSRYRRAGKTDPITNADEPIDLARPPDHYQVEIQNLIAAYQVLSNQLDSNTVSTDKIEKVLSAINNGLIGRSSKPQASAAAHAAKLAWKNSRYGLATGALIKGLRLNPVAFAIALTT